MTERIGPEQQQEAERDRAQRAGHDRDDLCVAEQTPERNGPAAAHLDGAGQKPRLAKHRQQLDEPRKHRVLAPARGTEQPRDDDRDGAGRGDSDRLCQRGDQIVLGHVQGSGLMTQVERGANRPGR